MKNIYVYVAILLAGCVLVACSETDEGDENNEDGAEDVVSVETAEAEEDDLTVTKSVFGRAEPSKTTPVMLESPGEIDSLEVEEDDDVDEDDTIAKVKTPEGKEKIKADADGRITDLDADEGEMASDEDPLATISEMDPMTLTFQVTSNVRRLFEKDDENDVHIDDDEHEATITKVKATPDDSGMYPVEAEVDNDDDDILSGMVARMEVPEKRVEDATIVPTSAVETEDSESTVFIVEDDKAVEVDVEIKETQSDHTAIDGDVEPGDEVVVSGQLTLDDGSEVDVTEAGNES